jgi:uncharacterized protein (TIGR02996 family)
MTDGDALLAYCYDNPDDDTARLVYADWLEETGDAERAEFIRIQLGLVSLVEGHPDGRDLRDREKALHSAHRKEWLSGLPSSARSKASFHRGLPTQFGMTARYLLQHGKALRKRTPITGLSLQGFAGNVREVLASGLLAGIRELSLSFKDLTAEDIIDLSRSPGLSELRRLNIYPLSTSSDAWQSLIHSPSLGNLEDLSVSLSESHLLPALRNPGIPFRLKRLQVFGGNDGFTQLGLLAGAKCLSGLESIYLSFEGRNVDRLGEVIGSLDKGRLRSLHAYRCQVSDGDIHKLMDSQPTALESLMLYSNNITSAGAAMIAESPHLGRLVSLELGDNQIGNEGLASLAESGHLMGMRKLSVPSLGITDIGLTALSNAPWLGRIRHLVLSGNSGITEEGIRRLVTTPAVAGLCEFECWSMGVNPESMTAIATSPFLLNRRTLGLGDNRIGPEGASAIASSRHLPSLRTLLLSRNRIGDRGAQILLDSPIIDQLTYLVLMSNGLKKPMRERIRQQKGEQKWHV